MEKNKLSTAYLPEITMNRIAGVEVVTEAVGNVGRRDQNPWRKLSDHRACAENARLRFSPTLAAGTGIASLNDPSPSPLLVLHHL